VDPSNGWIIIRFPSPVRGRIVGGLGAGVVLFVLGMVMSALRDMKIDWTLLAFVSVVFALYTLVRSDADVLRVSSDFAQLDTVFDSVLIDRSQQDAPYYDSDSDSLRFGGGSNPLIFAHGLGPQGAAMVAQAFGQAGSSTPDAPATSRPWLEFAASALGRVVFFVVVGAFAVFGVSESLAYAAVVVALLLIDIASTAWRRSHPRPRDLSWKGSG